MYAAGVAQEDGADLDAAQASYQRLLELAPEDAGWRAIALGNLGNIAYTRGDLDEAERLYREALEIFSTLGSLKGQAAVPGNLGIIAWTRGDLDEAERLFNEALELNRKLGSLEGQANQLGNLGIIAEERGDLAQAAALWTEARDLYARIGMPHRVELVQGWLDELPPDARPDEGT